jgi:ABC-type maltose transport system permease subunit
VKNSVIVVVVWWRSRRPRSSPRSRSRSTAQGRKVFIVLVIRIQMPPALIIPLYVVLAKYNQVNKLTG